MVHALCHPPSHVPRRPQVMCKLCVQAVCKLCVLGRAAALKVEVDGAVESLTALFCGTPDAPLLVKYDVERPENGHLQFYLAPKIDEE